ncbi:MAG TPA: vWA domain-containing protein [Chloroflexia bacterium]|nr:vWA domain-containing protein [Chloroflexia bacterium]
MKRRLSSFTSLMLLAFLIVTTVACGGEAAISMPSPDSAKAPAASTSREEVDRLAPPKMAADAEPTAAFAETSSPHSEPAARSAAPAGAAPVEARSAPELHSGSVDAPKSAAGGPPATGRDEALNFGTEALAARYQSDLTAGQVDDNAKFDDYLTFLSNYQGEPVLPIPVAQRLFVRVVDGDQHPVAGARVQLFDGERPVFDGSTVSDGRALFLPEAANAAQAQQFRAVISRGRHQVEATLKAGVLDQTVTLDNLKDHTGAVGLDIAFLLDATGSMGDEIDKIKATVDSVAARIEQLPGSSQPRFGLVAYQDRGDSFVTKSWDFASVQEFSQNLSSLSALGGGDYPEAVNAGLRDTINLQGWADNSTGRRLRMIVLVGDAPPHLDYPNDPAYTDLLRQAVAKGIKIFPIGASGLTGQGEYIFRQFAQVTQGQFVFLTYANGVSGAPGTATNHSVSDFTVQNLDTLVVNLVAGEVANQTGERAQTYKPVPASIVVPATTMPASKSMFASIADAIHEFTDITVSWSTAFWLLVLGVGLAWAGRSPQRARLASLLPRRQLAPGPQDDLLVPEGTLDSASAYMAPRSAGNVRLYVNARSKGAGEQHTIPLRSLPPDVAARMR